MTSSCNFEFSVASAMACNGNGSGDREYLTWFADEARRRIAAADRTLCACLDLRDWDPTSPHDGLANAKAAWSYLIAVGLHLGDLGKAFANKPDLNALFADVQADWVAITKRQSDHHLRSRLFAI